jgi:protocatechuate 3,4-dioxygenase beta subunit
MQRRSFIKNSSLTVLSISAFGTLNWNGTGFEADSPTTTDILGPFYRPNAPIRTNLIRPGAKAKELLLKGVVLKEDGKTPVKNALVEIWHCDENEVYDNASDEYHYRAGQKTNGKGSYAFTTIIPVPYKANPDNESSWRPAHIHMRVSVPGQQDLITQLYFKGGKYVSTDRWASAPEAVNRVLDIKEDSKGASEVVFNVIMNKEFMPDAMVFEKVTGLFVMESKSIIEFTQNDDFLFMKRNGQIVEGLKYTGNNSFEGGIGFPKVSFALQPDGATKVAIALSPGKTVEGVKTFKYQ